MTNTFNYKTEKQYIKPASRNRNHNKPFKINIQDGHA